MTGYNSAKKVTTTTPGAWSKWPYDADHIIKFIKTYLRIKLADFQCDAIRKIFAKGVRTAEYSMARGNGKSTFTAALVIAHLFLYQPDEEANEPPAQVAIVSTTIKNAGVALWSVVKNLISTSPELNNRCIIFNSIGRERITVPYNGAEMQSFADDPVNLNGLNPSLAVLDEAGFVDVESWNVIQLAKGKRPTSLYLMTGTTGLQGTALHHYENLYRQGKRFKSHVRIVYSAPEGCKLDDREAWKVANPAPFFDIDVLDDELDSVSEAEFRAYRLNQWVILNRFEPWLGINGSGVWAELADTTYLWDNDAATWAGLDASYNDDTTALVQVQRRASDGRWQVKAEIWNPRDSATGVIDYEQIKDRVRAIPNLEACSYDQRFFADSAQQLEREGVPMLEVLQGWPVLKPLYRQLEVLILGGHVRHYDDAEFTKHVLTPHKKAKSMSREGFILAKDTGFIDACVALAFAFFPITNPTESEEPTDFLSIKF